MYAQRGGRKAKPCKDSWGICISIWRAYIHSFSLSIFLSSTLSINSRSFFSPSSCQLSLTFKFSILPSIFFLSFFTSIRAFPLWDQTPVSGEKPLTFLFPSLTGAMAQTASVRSWSGARPNQTRGLWNGIQRKNKTGEKVLDCLEKTTKNQGHGFQHFHDILNGYFILFLLSLNLRSFNMRLHFASAVLKRTQPFYHLLCCT